jgi:hypothetical protein
MEALIRNLRLLEDIFHGIEAFLGDVRFFQRIRGFLKIFYVKWSFFFINVEQLFKYIFEEVEVFLEI